jgi:hypothetical protein
LGRKEEEPRGQRDTYQDGGDEAPSASGALEFIAVVRVVHGPLIGQVVPQDLPFVAWGVEALIAYRASGHLARERGNRGARDRGDRGALDRGDRGALERAGRQPRPFLIARDDRVAVRAELGSERARPAALAPRDPLGRRRLVGRTAPVFDDLDLVAAGEVPVERDRQGSRKQGALPREDDEVPQHRHVSSPARVPIQARPQCPTVARMLPRWSPM